MELSFAKFLERKEKDDKPTFLTTVDKELGITPDAYDGHVAAVADRRSADGKTANNIVPVIYKLRKNSGTKVVGADAKVLGDLEGNPLTRKYVKTKKGWRDQGRTDTNRKEFIKDIDSEITQGMGGHSGSPFGM